MPVLIGEGAMFRRYGSKESPKSRQSHVMYGAVVRVSHVGQLPLLGSVPNILSTVDGRSSVSIVIRRIM